jgi:hypothetical protein
MVWRGSYVVYIATLLTGKMDGITHAVARCRLLVEARGMRLR